MTIYIALISKMGKMKKQVKREMRYHLAGWISFVICAILFMASSLRNHDTLALIGSIVFLIACIFFLIPLVESYKKMDDDILR